MQAAYDADARERRSVKRGVFWFIVFIVGTYGIAYMYRLYVGPYKFAYKRRLIEYEKALVDLSTPTCADPVLRAQLEGYNNCERSRLITEDSVRGLAFHDVLTELKWCNQGGCYFFDINATDVVWPLFRLVAPMALLLYVLSFIGLITWQRAHSVGMYQLPMMGAADAAYMHAALEAREQQRIAAKQYSASMPPPMARDKLD